MRVITNNPHDSKILSLGFGDVQGPYLVTQTGVNPAEELPRTKMFVLRPDGCWVDFNAYACQNNPKVMDELVFPSMSRVMEKFGTLLGKPRVLDLPVDEEGLKVWVDRQQNQGNPLKAAQAWAVDYRIRHRDETVS